MAKQPEPVEMALLPRPSPFSLLSGGREAFREVAGLRGFVWRGMLLNYLVFGVLGFLAMGGIYTYGVAPLTDSLQAWSAGEGFWLEMLSGLLRALVWLANLLVMAGTLVLSLILSLAMMSVWFEGMATRIVAHWRPDAAARAPAYSLGALLKGIGRSLGESLGLLLLAVAALALGLVPLVGPLLVLVVDGYLLGWEVRAPYLAVREELGDTPRRLRRRLGWWTFQTGLIPVFLAMVPIVGWLLLPPLLIQMVAGAAWRGEQALHGAG